VCVEFNLAVLLTGIGLIVACLPGIGEGDLFHDVNPQGFY